MNFSTFPHDIACEFDIMQYGTWPQPDVLLQLITKFAVSDVSVAHKCSTLKSLLIEFTLRDMNECAKHTAIQLRKLESAPDFIKILSDLTDYCIKN